MCRLDRTFAERRWSADNEWAYQPSRIRVKTESGGPLPGVLYQYLSSDHNRLDRLLEQAAARPGTIDMESYSEFRKGLFRHISIEEKIVFPSIHRRRGDESRRLIDRLHLDHAAIVSLMVPPPNASIILTLKSVFAVHNPLEEDEGGLYGLFEASVGAESEIILEKMTAAPAVAVLPHNPKPELLELAKEALRRAGHEFKEA